MAIPRLLHSLYGFKVGVTRDGYLVSKLNDIASESTAVALGAGGLSPLSSATATYSLSAPQTGIPKTVFTTSTSTNVRTITLASGNFQTTAGTSFITYTLAGGGQYISLVGLSTAAYLVVGTNSSAAPTT